MSELPRRTRHTEVSGYSHLLDTSALLAHYFDEPGAAEVDAIWQDPASRPAVCVLTLAELRSRLRIEVVSIQEIDRVYDLYANHLTASVPVDRRTAEAAARLRAEARDRLPLVDACIAACARLHDCLLVHRDPHMDQLEGSGLRMIRLADKRT